MFYIDLLVFGEMRILCSLILDTLEMFLLNEFMKSLVADMKSLYSQYLYYNKCNIDIESILIEIWQSECVTLTLSYFYENQIDLETEKMLNENTNIHI